MFEVEKFIADCERRSQDLRINSRSSRRGGFDPVAVLRLGEPTKAMFKKL